MHDPVNNPAHYQTDSGLEAIDVIEAFFQDDYHLGNAFKYLARAGKKDDREQDLRKAVWYIERSLQKKKPLDDYPVEKVKVVADLVRFGDLEDFIHEGEYWVHSKGPWLEEYYLTPEGKWVPPAASFSGYYHHEGDVQVRLEDGSLLPGRGEE